MFKESAAYRIFSRALQGLRAEEQDEIKGNAQQHPGGV
jgi:hypothetical protein